MILRQQHCDKTNLEMIIETSKMEEAHFNLDPKQVQEETRTVKANSHWIFDLPELVTGRWTKLDGDLFDPVFQVFIQSSDPD
jgi:hypothetical protein